MNVEVSIDKMFGIMWFSEPEDGELKVNANQVRDAIAQRGIVYGIDESIIEEICTHIKYNYKYFVAKGIKPSMGTDAYIEYSFDLSNLNNALPTLKEDGTVDFKDLNIICNVAKGDVLAKKILAQEGEAGYNILGEKVPGRKGKDVRLPSGKNTKVLENGLTLIATSDGQVQCEAQSISISPTFYVEKDVDSSTGNIQFVGNVIVKGSVHSGYKIKASGNVEIYGYVEAADIESDGNIILHHGIQGSEKGRLRAKGNIVAKFIQNAIVHSGGDIITEAILHSQIASDGEVFVQRGKGIIVGGTVIASQRITAKMIGSTMSTITNIQIGVSQELITRYKELKDKYTSLKEESDKVNKNITFLENKEREGLLTEEKRVLYKKLCHAKIVFTNQLAQTYKELMEIEETIRNAGQGIVKVHDTVYQGVRVTMGNVVHHIMQEVHHCSLQKIKGDIVVGVF